MKKCSEKLPSTASLISIFALSASPTIAQNDGLTLEEVIVTASRRETSLQDTPIAVTAMTADLMEELNVVNPFSYEKLVPSLTYQESPNRLSIRGVGRFTNALGVSPGVAIYNDGVYQSEAASLNTQAINIERTEVLRGPQGTLYGRNTTGGAVNIISRKPSAEFEVDMRVRLGNYDLHEYSGVISGPITDNLRFKLHGQDTARDGLQRNFAGRDLRESNSDYYEGQLEWEVTDRLNLWFEYSEYAYDFVPGDSVSQDPYDCVNFWGGLGMSAQFLECQAGEENPAIGDVRQLAYNTPGFQRLTDNQGIALKASYDLGFAELSYLYGSVEYDYDQRTDYDRTANDYSVLLDIGQYQDQTTHELQLTSDWEQSWDFIVGLYYFEDLNEQPFKISAPDWPQYQTVISPDFEQTWSNPDGIIYFQNGVLDIESWAVFGEADIPLTDNWTLSLGARYSDDKFDGGETQLQYYDLQREGLPFAFDASQSTFAGDPNRYTSTIDASYSDSFNNVSGKINLSYRTDADQLFWGTVSSGYKMGGVRLGSLEKFYSEAAGVPSDGRFEEEEVITYELGWKGVLLDNRLQTEVVTYFSDYTNMQQLRNFQTPPPANLTLGEVVNLDTQMYGLEVSGTYLVTDNLRAILAYSHNNTEITDEAFFENFTYGDRDENGIIIPTNVNGNQLTLTPENKLAFTMHYFWPTAVGEFSFGGTYSYMDERFFDLGNFDSEGSYSILDLQASWTSETGRYKILANMTNALDEEAYNTFGCTVNGGAEFGTSEFIRRCAGNPINQRLWDVQFMVKL